MTIFYKGNQNLQKIYLRKDYNYIIKIIFLYDFSNDKINIAIEEKININKNKIINKNIGSGNSKFKFIFMINNAKLSIKRL